MHMVFGAALLIVILHEHAGAVVTRNKPGGIAIASLTSHETLVDPGKLRWYLIQHFLPRRPSLQVEAPAVHARYKRLANPVPTVLPLARWHKEGGRKVL
jgi:hypothetical protein